MKLPEHLGEYMVYPMIHLHNNPQLWTLHHIELKLEGGFNPYRPVTSPVTGRYGLIPPCHDRAVSLFQGKVLVRFQCVEWDKKIKPTNTKS